jgi:hypothetical protein
MLRDTQFERYFEMSLMVQTRLRYTVDNMPYFYKYVLIIKLSVNFYISFVQMHTLITNVSFVRVHKLRPSLISVVTCGEILAYSTKNHLFTSVTLNEYVIHKERKLSRHTYPRCGHPNRCFYSVFRSL